MSFKLSELLNPAPTSSHREPSKSHSHSPPAPPSASPTYTHTGYGHTEGGGYGIECNVDAAVTSSYEAAAALTALATSGSGSYAPTYSSTAHPHFMAPTLPSLSSLPPPPPPHATPAAARRASYSALPPFSDRIGNTTHLPSPTTSDLEYYRSSRSPDELRRQSYPTFEHLAGSSASTGGGAGGGAGSGIVATSSALGGPQLAPLQAVASMPPLDQGAGKGDSKNASVARETSLLIDTKVNNSQSLSQSQSQHFITPPPNKSSPSPSSSHQVKSTTTPNGKMDEQGEKAGLGVEIQQPAPTQIREPSAAAPEAVMTPQAPEPADRQPLDAAAALSGLSPNPKIKDEPMNTPKEGTPVKDALLRGQSTQGDEDVDENTLKAIEAAKNDFGLRGTKQKAQPSIEEPPPVVSSGATVGEESKSKKRPAPKVKKGQATVKKPPSKKRKVDDASSDARLSPSRGNKSTAQRAAGGGGKKSKSNTPALGSSPAPGSVVSGGDNESAYASDASSSGNDVFCICRKGDNHTWMIACDGGCEDWFHGKCVNILEDDGELIDKYICPNCAKTSGKVTTWLPGCRNRTCRRPARIRKGNMSKYCSDRCGKEFMEGEVRRSEEVRKAAGGKQKPVKPKRKGITMAEINGEAESDDDLGPRGGALKASELKVLVSSANGDVSAFRNLGAGVLSPPATVSPTAERFPSDPTTPDHLAPHEQSRLEAISKEKDHLRRRRALLKDREKFGQMVRENVSRYAEREKVKPKDVCGYDNRLTWSEEEFKRWRDSEDGVGSLASGVLELPSPKDTSKPEVNGSADHMDVDSDSSPDKEKEADAEKKASMCVKKRCERHRQWQKQALADVRFEESTLADQMRALEKEEREIRELGALRGRMEKGGLSGEGTVEVVEVA